MGPSKWRDIRQEVLRAIESSFSPLRDSDAELFGVPIDYDCGQQVQTGDAEVLAFRGAVADFALPPDPQCALQCMVGLAFVEAYLGAALHLGIEQPFDDKRCPFDPPDFAQRQCQVVLPRSRRQFLEEMTGLHPAGEHRCDAAQDIRPIGDDGGFTDALARQALQFFWDSLRVKDMQPLGGEVADTGDEHVSKQGCGGKNQIGKPASVGILFFDLAPCLIHEQPV